ncbi:alanine racemase [Pontixanthobacter sp.]|uniref:alanine racemase n=1 Tax=Pontixanthobacter sp. TaxID=2792078 RepID=UPI003C7A3FF7
MPEPLAPTLRLNIDTAAIAQNWRVLDSMSGAASAGAAVKADAYGLGLAKAVPALIKAGCRSYFVAHWGEAKKLLKYVPPQQISVLHGPLNAAEAQFAVSSGIIPVINSFHQANIWKDAGGKLCDVMVDTGINRLGLAMDDIGGGLATSLSVRTLMSHLASADEDGARNGQQRAKFKGAMDIIPACQYSLANSAGIALGPDYAYDLTRPGLALYGGIPRPELAGVIRQVAFLEAAILQIRTLKTGDTVGYNATFTARVDMQVGVVSLGYADGFLRSWAGHAVLMHHGNTLPVLGKISMDMIVVDLTSVPHCREGDWLEVPYALPEAARHSGLSQYELLTILGQRFARRTKFSH